MFQTLTLRLEVINTTTKTKLVLSVSFGNAQRLFRPFAFKMSIDRVAPSRVTRRVYYCPYLKRLTFATWKKWHCTCSLLIIRKMHILTVSLFACIKRNSGICRVWFNANSLLDKRGFDLMHQLIPELFVSVSIWFCINLSNIDW